MRWFRATVAIQPWRGVCILSGLARVGGPAGPKRRWSISFIALVWGAAACDSPPGRDVADSLEGGIASNAGTAPVTSTTRDTADSLSIGLVVPPEVRRGDVVDVAFRMQNTGTRPIELYLRGRSITVDIVITRGQDTVWHRLADEAIPAIIQLRALAPGEVIEVYAPWNQQSGSGGRAAAGDYAVRGMLLTEGRALETAPVPLRIVDR